MAQYSDNKTQVTFLVVQIWRAKVKNNKKQLASIKYQLFNGIKNYDFIDPIDEIYYQMWYEEQYPYYQFQLPERFRDSAYNFNVQNGINEWLEMRKKRENREITNQEYIEWKLNYKLNNPLK